MEVIEKIRFMRTFKGWTQEELADKLGISTHAYAKIERGETDVSLSRIKQIADVMEIELSQLFNLDENTIVNLTGKNQVYTFQCNQCNDLKVNTLDEQENYKHELEKTHFIIEQQQKEIELLKQQNNDLRHMLGLLKKDDS